MTEQPVQCARCGKPLAPDEAQLGQPLITAGELLRTIIKTPGILTGPPLAEVAYCAECRPIIAQKRVSEQLKVLGLMLLLLSVVAVVIIVVL